MYDKMTDMKEHIQKLISVIGDDTRELDEKYLDKGWRIIQISAWSSTKFDQTCANRTYSTIHRGCYVLIEKENG